MRTESEDESETSKAKRLAVEHLKGEIARVASQIDSLGPAPASLTCEQVLLEMWAEVVSLTSINFTFSDLVREYKDQLQPELPKMPQMPETHIDAMPTLNDVYEKEYLKHGVAACVDVVAAYLSSEELMTECIPILKEVLKNCTCSSNSTLRLERFEMLCDLFSEALSNHILAQVCKFTKAASKAVDEHFRMRLGYVYTWEDIDNLVRVLYEIALRVFLLEISADPSEMLRKLVHDTSTKRRMFAGEASEMTESQLMAESCASKRARLTQRKNSLTTALKELEQL